MLIKRWMEIEDHQNGNIEICPKCEWPGNIFPWNFSNKGVDVGRERL